MGLWHVRIAGEVLERWHARAGAASRNLSTNLMTLKTQAEVSPMPERSSILYEPAAQQL